MESGPYIAAVADPATGGFAQFDGITGKITGSPDIPPDCRVVTDDYKQLALNCLNHNIEIPSVIFDTGLAKYLLDGKSAEAADAVSALERAGAAWRDAARLAPEIAAAGLDSVLGSIEIPLCPVLARMERHGIGVDRAGLAGFGEELAGRLTELEADIRTVAGVGVNLNSPKQLAELLFDRLGLPAGKKTKSGSSTDIEVLEKLRGAHPVVERIIEYRRVAKLKATYVDGLLPLVGPDGRLHTHFNMTATSTGRLSSSDPNLQNIPVRSELGARLRRWFVPTGPDRVFVDLDYSQIELRVLAGLSGDRALLEAFRSGADIHAYTASQVFRVAPDAVTPELRRRAKAINFGIVYGISPFALAGDLGVSRAEAETYIKEYLDRYSGVRDYLRRVVADARRDGFTRTRFGRIRRLPELASKVWAVRSFGERAAMNAPMQGTSADLIKLAMIRADRELAARHPGAALVLQVHDELIADVPAADADAVARTLRDAMEHVADLGAPLAVETSVGTNWGEC